MGSRNRKHMIGIVGKPNVGKSLLFNVWTGEHAKTSSYPFCTIDPNEGCAWINVKCPCSEFNKICGLCQDQQRLFPIQLVDIAGVVKDSSEGKGMGNRFLAEILQQSILLEIIDITGSLNDEGVVQEPSLDQVWHDLDFLQLEMANWLSKLIERNSIRTLPRLINFYRGFHISEHLVEMLFKDVRNYHEYHNVDRVQEILRQGKISIVILNKSDQASPSMIQAVCERLQNEGRNFFLYSALLDYGLQSEKHHAHSAERMKALKILPGKVILSRILFDQLGFKLIFPVKHLPALTDDHERVLPDIIMLPKDGTCLDLAFQIHQDLGTHFIRGIDAKTHLALAKHSVLTHRQVVRIVAKT